MVCCRLPPPRRRYREAAGALPTHGSAGAAAPEASPAAPAEAAAPRRVYHAVGPLPALSRAAAAGGGGGRSGGVGLAAVTATGPQQSGGRHGRALYGAAARGLRAGRG